jgi:hypothetical protein
MSWFDPSLLPSFVLVIVAFLVRELVAGLLHAAVHDVWSVLKRRIRRSERRIEGSQHCAGGPHPDEPTHEASR